MTARCEQCGAELAEGSRFCTNCGAPAGSGADEVSSATMKPAAAQALSASSQPATGTAVAEAVPFTRVDPAPGPASPTAASATPAAPSGPIPNWVIIGVGVGLLLIAFILHGITHRTHHPSLEEVRPQGAWSDTGAAREDAERKIHSDELNAVQGARDQVESLIRDSTHDSATSTRLENLRSQVGQIETDLVSHRNVSPEQVKKALADVSEAATQLTPAILAATDAALTPPPIPSGPPMVPVAGTGDPKHDWPLEYERTVGGPEADLVVRTGDINNLGFGWPSGFDPFSGKSTPGHPWPDINQIPPQAPVGTDRILIGTGVTPVHMHLEHIPGKLDRVVIDAATITNPADGYSGVLEPCYALRNQVPADHCGQNPIHLPPGEMGSELWADTQSAASCTKARALTMPAPIVLDVGELPGKIDDVVVQIFVDDFQAAAFHSYFQVSLNGTRIPDFEYAINSLDQTGPIGKLLSLRLLPEYWPLLKSGTVSLLIDDPTTHVQDGYAIDFVRILVNPHNFKYKVSLSATVTDAATHKPIAGATVSVGTASVTADKQGKCQLKDIPAGLVVATGNAPGYDQNSVPVDLPAGQSGHADIPLQAHQESTAALEKSIAQTGTVNVYGIHFDTGSSKLRNDSMPALNAILGRINGRPGSKWTIEGHTDNQGSDALNIPLSKARAASVVAWLTGHGITADRLQPEGFGSTRPVADNATASGRALNRRVEVSLAK